MHRKQLQQAIRDALKGKRVSFTFHKDHFVIGVSNHPNAKNEREQIKTIFAKLGCKSRPATNVASPHLVMLAYDFPAQEQVA